MSKHKYILMAEYKSEFTRETIKNNANFFFSKADVRAMRRSIHSRQGRGIPAECICIEREVFFGEKKYTFKFTLEDKIEIARQNTKRDTETSGAIAIDGVFTCSLSTLELVYPDKKLFDKIQKKIRQKTDEVLGNFFYAKVVHNNRVYEYFKTNFDKLKLLFGGECTPAQPFTLIKFKAGERTENWKNIVKEERIKYDLLY